MEIWFGNLTIAGLLGTIFPPELGYKQLMAACQILDDELLVSELKITISSIYMKVSTQYLLPILVVEVMNYILSSSESASPYCHIPRRSLRALS
mmetsp:Transcript_31827/g.38500  ORF Transcript_31827/g.38500 Transcript_31827/m.38500 type:complete len:94 (+) Transcript_31827:255-536(+)